MEQRLHKKLPKPVKLLPADKQYFLSLLEEKDTSKVVLPKSILLLLSSEMTSCHTRNEFLHFIKPILSKVFPYKEKVVSLSNENGETYCAFLNNLTKWLQNYRDDQERALKKNILESRIFLEVLNSDRYLIFEREDIMRREYFPPHIDLFYQNSIKQCMGIPLDVNN